MLPLSALQTGILAASGSSKSDQVYVTQAVFQLSELVDAKRWSNVWRALIERHEALRAIFLTDRASEPVQVIVDSAFAEIPVLHLQSQALLESTLKTEREQGFDLEREPPLRLKLITVNDRCFHVLTFHHVLLDGWSVENLMSEALALYASRELDEPVSIRRYLAWYRSQRESAGQYWTQALDDWPGPVQIAGDSANDGDGIQDAAIEHLLDEHQTDALKKLAQEYSSTTNAILTALWTALLARVSGDTDITFGVVNAGRDAPVLGISKIVGLLMNAMPVRVQSSDAQTVAQLAADVTERISSGAVNGHLPVGDMLRSAGVTAVPETPWNTMLVFEKVPELADIPGELSIVSREYSDQTSVALSVLVFPEKDNLRFKFQYNSARFEKHTVNALVHGLICGIEKFTADPDTRLGEYRFGAPPHDGPVPAKSPGVPPSVVGQIQQNFATHPDAIAIVQGDRQHTYAELGLRTSQAILWFRSQQLQPGCPVVTALPTSFDAVAIILGALHCGHPYVYLDPAYPPAHHSRVMDVLADEFKTTIPRIGAENTGAHTGVDEIFADQQTGHIDAPRTPIAIEDDLAYVVFTSGSSGKPKGVKVSHANLNYSNAARNEVYADRPERFLLLSSLAFDSSVVGLFWTLSSGGTLTLPTDSLAKSLDQLPELVQRHQITHTLCLPSVYAVLLERASPEQLESLRCVIVAGENCSAQVVQSHDAGTTATTLFNEYGPSEATVWCSATQLCEDNIADGISIGSPPPQTAATIVNKNREVLADGLAGELVVTGPGVAQGYIGAVEDGAFFTRGADRCYATGDLGVVRDGMIYLLGRDDAQVKVNGVRIELADVERQIESIEHVDSAVVVATSDPQGRTRLAGHFVANAGIDVDSSTIIEKLRTLVPAAAVPSQLTRCDDFPRLPNGKVDRGALATSSSVVVEQPATGDVNASATIRALMQRVTGVAPDSDLASFFDIGGDSLGAVNLVDRVNSEFDVSLNVADVYSSPTPRDLADLVNRRAGRTDWLAVTPITTTGKHLPLYFGYGNAAILGQHLGPDIPLSWVVHGRHGIVFPTASIVELASRHYRQIRDRQPVGPYCLAGFSFGALVMVEIARLLRDAGESVPMLVLIDPTSPPNGAIPGGLKRASRLLARRDVSVASRLRFQVASAARTIRSTVGSPDLPKQADTLATMTLQTGDRIDRTTIIKEVSSRLAEHPFSVCPGKATVVLPAPSSARTLHNANQQMLWDSLFADEVEHLEVPVGGSHTELFADVDAMNSVADLLRSAVIDASEKPD